MYKMTKKVFLMVAIFMFAAFGIAGAAQIDGLANDAGPALPTIGQDPLHVYVNPGGLGDALLFGYFNVRGNKVDYFQIVNTDTTHDVAVKVRFREAETITKGCGETVDCGSLEVLDFIVCLSKGDVWTGAVTGFGTGPATLFSLDTDTATVPAIPAAGQAFATVVTANGLTITADQTKEGYFEVLGLGIIDLTKDECANQVIPSGDAPNVLMGTNYLVDDEFAEGFLYKATALADFNNAPVQLTLGNEDYNLANGQDFTGLTAVDYVLTKSDLIGTYVTDPALGAETSMVVTFPTKILNQRNATNLFNNPAVRFNVWDTAENLITPTTGFSPSFIPTEELPNEVNVLNFCSNANSCASSIFVSGVQGDIKAVHPTLGDFNLGWIDLDLTAGADCSEGISCVAADQMATAGLPALGYDFQEMAGGAFSGVYPMSYKVNIGVRMDVE